MSLWDRVMTAIAVNPAAHPPKELERPPDRTLSFPALSEQMTNALRERQAALRPWRAASIHEALGVPANLRSVMLISNTMGIFTLEAYKNGVRVPNADRPRLIVRPNPFTTARDFLRDVGWSMATRGENWLWVAARDIDTQPLSVIPVPSREIKTEGDWLSPTVRWRGAVKTSDLVPVYLTKELGDTRGRGPLQYCGAAISAAVESQEWAANYYAAGGNPNVLIKSEYEVSEDEAARLRQAWTATPPNMPQVISGPMDVKELGAEGSDARAQMLEARNWNAGEAARMWGIPGALLEYSRGGSSLTYANVVTLMDQFLKQCLIPDYLEPLEQVMTDLLPRSWIARFNVDSILRADIKTRFEVYKLGLDSGVYQDAAEPRAIEGLDAGSIETAPVPYSPPAAFPAGIPPRTFGNEWRCDGCNRKLAETRGVGTTMRCRCGALATA